MIVAGPTESDLIREGKIFYAANEVNRPNPKSRIITENTSSQVRIQSVIVTGVFAACLKCLGLYHALTFCDLLCTNVTRRLYCLTTVNIRVILVCCAAEHSSYNST